MDNDKLQLFENKAIRTAWDEEKEEWYFSIVDVVAVLTDSPNPQTYWRVMKKRLKDEGNETVTNCNALKMTAADGKKRLTDVATTEQLLRIIQSIPSPKLPSPAGLLQTHRLTEGRGDVGGRNTLQSHPSDTREMSRTVTGTGLLGPLMLQIETFGRCFTGLSRSVTITDSNNL